MSDEEGRDEEEWQWLASDGMHRMFFFPSPLFFREVDMGLLTPRPDADKAGEPKDEQGKVFKWVAIIKGEITATTAEKARTYVTQMLGESIHINILDIEGAE